MGRALMTAPETPNASERPALTIAVPTFNRSQYLRRCLESIRASAERTRMAVQVCILDNASDDETPTVVEKARSSLPLNYVRNPTNIGANRNIAAAARAGSGRYVWVLGDDDYLRPGALQCVESLLQSRPGYLVANYAVNAIAAQGAAISRWFKISDDVRLVRPEEALERVGASAGFISAIIAERGILDCLDPDTEEKWLVTGFNQLYAFYTGIQRRSSIGIITKRPLFDAGNAAREGIDYAWEEYFIDGFGRIFDALERLFPVESVRSARREALRRFVGPRLTQLRMRRFPTRTFMSRLYAAYHYGWWDLPWKVKAAGLPLPLLALALRVRGMPRKFQTLRGRVLSAREEQTNHFPSP